MQLWGLWSVASCCLHAGQQYFGVQSTNRPPPPSLGPISKWSLVQNWAVTLSTVCQSVIPVHEGMQTFLAKRSAIMFPRSFPVCASVLFFVLTHQLCCTWSALDFAGDFTAWLSRSKSPKAVFKRQLQCAAEPWTAGFDAFR